MSNRQYVTAKFNAWDKRTYTYHNDGPPVAEGAKVRVETKRGEATVEIVSVGLPPPAFETKPILGPADGALL